ncbi:hypothetical protein M413DRAFT_419961 [Hebeloma cylindrosporum]|uniref:DUF6699 domain-containing protein n=1 Tax=Hebeloma cylindrosporum TaxID=76867 RepID=A0A0C3C4V7_HEBCY|nr:hypothetical protein M413DRAFT_419961 [Hebeloma cylindrosporum h7]
MSEHAYTRYYDGYSRAPSDSSWGTPSSVHSKASLGTITTNLSFASHPSPAPPSNHSWGSSTIAVPSAQGGWVGPMPNTPPYLANSPMSTATTLVNSPMHGTVYSHPEYTSAVRICPLLAPGVLGVDLGLPMRANKSYFANVDFNAPAFFPTLSYATLLFRDYQRWSITISEPHGVTVWDVLEQIFQYLQRPDAVQDVQALRSISNPQGEARYSRTNSLAKRIEIFRGRQTFKGLTPAGYGDNCWFVDIA